VVGAPTPGFAKLYHSKEDKLHRFEWFAKLFDSKAVRNAGQWAYLKVRPAGSSRKSCEPGTSFAFLKRKSGG
jgi:hypothetical protein